MKHKQNFSKTIDKLTLIEENSQYYSLTKNRYVFENYQPRTNKVQTPMKNETGFADFKRITIYKNKHMQALNKFRRHQVIT